MTPSLTKRCLKTNFTEEDVANIHKKCLDARLKIAKVLKFSIASPTKTIGDLIVKSNVPLRVIYLSRSPRDLVRSQGSLRWLGKLNTVSDVLTAADRLICGRMLRDLAAGTSRNGATIE